MSARRPDLGLERLLVEFEREVLGSSDEEILEIACELGMKPDLQGSSAFFGVTLLYAYGSELRGRPDSPVRLVESSEIPTAK